MLNSYHYYACVILCLLHQQQQAAAALTIIIDGATTNEWQTRDEDQRLVAGGHGVRTIQDLVPLTDADVEQQQQQQQQQQLTQQQQQQQQQQLNQQQERKEQQASLQLQDPRQAPLLDAFASSIKRRNSAPQKFCGEKLIDVLELVCQGRYYSPIIVEPTIKSKRFVAGITGSNIVNKHNNGDDDDDGGADGLLRWQQQQLMDDQQQVVEQMPQIRPALYIPAANRQQQQHQQQTGGVTRRRKWRTFENTDGDSMTDDERIMAMRAARLHHQQLNAPSSQLSSASSSLSISSSSPLSPLSSNLNDNIEDSNSFKSSRLRRIRGASGECCKSACRLDDLKQYCKP